VRTGLRLVIDTQADMAVVGEAADGAEALVVAREARPDVILLDLSMPRTNGVKTIGQLARLRPATRVLVLTMHDDPAYVDSALAAGASGYVVKKAADLELLSAIRAVSRGRHAVDATLTTGGSHSTPSRGRLSRRESEVLRLLGQGLTNRQVAAQLRLSVKTAETYRARLYEKLGFSDRADLVSYALRMGVLEAERVDIPEGGASSASRRRPRPGRDHRL
jgi:DNA-binding NarL/FixJ family response regulator